MPKTSKAKQGRRCAIYVRISRDRHDEVSTATQEDMARTYAQSKGWQVVEVFTDRGRSAYKRGVRRPGFDDMMDAVERGTVDAVVAYRLDRVSRSVRDFANFWERLTDAGAEFVSVSESFDTSTAMGRAMVQIAVTFAELESAVKSERISDAMAHRRALGAPTHGPRPFGLTADRKKTVPVEARLVRAAAKRVLDGDGLLTIVKQWNEKGETTPRGKQWSTRALSFILTSPTTAGMQDVDGELVAGRMPAVLARETWDQVRAVLLNPARRTTKGPGRTHLLSGVVRCQRCKTPMSAKPGRDRTRYTCAPRTGHDACGACSIYADVVDDVVTTALFNFIDEPTLRRLRAASNGGDADDVEDRAKELAAMYAAGDITKAEWMAAKAGLQDRREAVRQVPRALLGITSLADDWDNLTLPGQQEIVRAMFNYVEVEPSQGQRCTDVESAARIVVDGGWRF